MRAPSVDLWHPGWRFPVSHPDTYLFLLQIPTDYANKFLNDTMEPVFLKYIKGEKKTFSG